MANILRLATEDYTDTASKVDLLTGGLKLARGGYEPTIGARHAGRVEDVISLAREDTPANLFTDVNDIEELLTLAALWHEDPYQYNSIWLEVTSDGETEDSVSYGARRALLYDGMLSLAMPDGFRGAFLDNAAFTHLNLSRHRWFENIYTKSIESDFGGSQFWGNTWDLTAQSAYAGNAPARIAHLRVYSVQDYFDRGWIGIRSEHEGISGFEEIWELEDGTAGTDTSSGAVSGASSSDAMTCTFSTSTDLEDRVTIKISDVVVSDYDHFVGKYLVLLRCKVGASTTCGVRMVYGSQDTVFAQLETQYIDNTSWMLVELGEIRIPPSDFRRTSDLAQDMSAFSISIEASRISGSGSLDLDAICLIPSEHLFTFSDMDPSGWAPEIHGFTLPDDRHMARVENSSGVLRINPPFSAINWALPVDPGLMVAQFQETSSHDMTAYGIVKMEYYPRWNLYRTR